MKASSSTVASRNPSHELDSPRNRFLGGIKIPIAAKNQRGRVFQSGAVSLELSNKMQIPTGTDERVSMLIGLASDINLLREIEGELTNEQRDLLERTIRQRDEILEMTGIRRAVASQTAVDPFHGDFH